ncbi:MAG: DUF4351 domain-containing protein [Gomphosphaeria aponina SAG 52.96 = DSM 107014]|uniref:DUF4351 domain-containing protein n=1 Tax=Gomphosphaeria aponina SAG 52.96 = DSM 107014 TaxID=1521640 RepID=A0A941GSN9_9CHRO|nr:DUF4351 domain-containing protein [Gomphosphaeria aponina SAG 52.96 = DSM 107014]
MPFLSTMEKMAIERGKESGAKENCQKNICQILEKRFGKLSKDLVKQINQIEELNVLEQLHLETISVNSVADFQTLIEPHLKSEN